MVLESVVESAGDKAAKAAGFLVRKVQWIGRRGAPDKMYARADTGPFLVEYKAPGKDLQPHQVREIARLREHGWKVHVIDTVEAARALFA